jgi:D-glutamate cyclase
MPLSPLILDKIHRMERWINCPPPLPSHPEEDWENLPMAPYSNLTGAVSSLAEKGRAIAIVTGFFVPSGNPPATETDGPPGALVLAEGLKRLGMDVLLMTDSYSLSALNAGLKSPGLSDCEIPVVSFPLDHPDQHHPTRTSNEEKDSEISLRFVRSFFESSPGRDLSHLIYIERVGPNHTVDSFLAQQRPSQPPIKDFEAVLPAEMRNRCFNVRLHDVTPTMAKTHFLLEHQQRLGLSIETIGIGDRGNEVGTGTIPWEALGRHSRNHREATFCCRIPTDYLVSSGISNWAGYALVAGVALAKGRKDVLRHFHSEKEWKVLDTLIRQGPAIDGITGRQTHSVDGIEFCDYMKVIEGLIGISLE